MLNKTLTILAVLLSACVDSPEGVGMPNVIHKDPAVFDGRLQTVEQSVANDGTNACDLLPDEGPCALACDQDALFATIDPGTCVSYHCELADGSQINIGGCRP